MFFMIKELMAFVSLSAFSITALTWMDVVTRLG